MALGVRKQGTPTAPRGYSMTEALLLLMLLLISSFACRFPPFFFLSVFIVVFFALASHAFIISYFHHAGAFNMPTSYQ